MQGTLVAFRLASYDRNRLSELVRQALAMADID